MILQRIEGERFSRVRPSWAGIVVVILGGGPSMTAAQIEMVQHARASDAVRVIAINDAYLVAPWADVCYAADAKWHVWHQTGISKPKLGLSAIAVRERWAAFAGQKCSIQVEVPYFPEKSHLAADVHVLQSIPRGLSRDPCALATGRQDGYTGHSGFQALNLATLSGGTTILLLGFDGRPGNDGRTNFHGEHPVPTPSAVWDYIRRSFSCIENELKAAGITVLNCSADSAIDTFPKVPLVTPLMVPA